MPRSLIGALALALVACRQPPAKIVEPGPEPAEPDAAEAEATSTGRGPGPGEGACSARIAEDGQVLVAGKPTGLEAIEEYGRVRTFPWDESSVLLAVGNALPFDGFLGKGEEARLWRVPCKNPTARELELELEGADFVWAVLEPEREGLLFSADGVMRYDFEARDWGPVIARPSIDRCWLAEEPTTGDEWVVRWIGEGDDRLLIYSGGPCGFEAEWLGAAVVLEDPLGAAPRRRPAAHVGSVNADGQGRIWVGDGGLCEAAQTLNSPSSPGLWRSEDLGQSWNFIEIPELEGRGVKAIWSGPAKPDRIIAQAECCYGEAADFCFGGTVVRSDDGGASWTRISPSPRDQPGLEGPVDRLAVDPDLETLRAYVLGYDGDHWQISHDGGDSWAKAELKGEIAARISRSVEQGGQRFEATVDGLLRRAIGEPEASAQVVLWPGPHAIADPSAKP